jgi:hypothetical protein
MAPDRESNEAVAISRSSWYVIVAALLIIFLLIALVAVSSIKAPLSQIRIRNSTDRDFEDVIVGRGHYGSIRPGDVSGYQSWGPAYRFARVALTADGKPLRLQPEDYAGETPLGIGRFTYVLSIHHESVGDELDIELVKD